MLLDFARVLLQFLVVSYSHSNFKLKLSIPPKQIPKVLKKTNFNKQNKDQFV